MLEHKSTLLPPDYNQYLNFNTVHNCTVIAAIVARFVSILFDDVNWVPEVSRVAHPRMIVCVVEETVAVTGTDDSEAKHSDTRKCWYDGCGIESNHLQADTRTTISFVMTFYSLRITYSDHLQCCRHYPNK